MIGLGEEIKSTRLLVRGNVNGVDRELFVEPRVSLLDALPCARTS